MKAVYSVFGSAAALPHLPRFELFGSGPLRVLGVFVWWIVASKFSAGQQLEECWLLAK